MERPLAALDKITDIVVAYRPERKQPEAKKQARAKTDKKPPRATKGERGDV